MNSRLPGRRDFLKQTGVCFGGSWLAASAPLVLAVAQTACRRRDENSGWASLSPGEAEGLAAVAEQIFPAGDTPGATDAGVVYFIDAALAGFMAAAAPGLRQGLAELDREASGLQGTGTPFAALDFDRQKALLQEVEDSPFFQTMLFLTQAGMFSMPAHGGNRGRAGWRLIGFDARHAWQPPFGYYDATASAGEADDDRT